MAISIADKFELDIPAQAKTLEIPTNVLKLIIQKLYGMAAWRLIPDKIAFVEKSKMQAPISAGAKGGFLAAPPIGEVLVNGVDEVVIGVGPGQGTDVTSAMTYICKAAKTVFDLSPWYATMDAKLK